MKTRVLFASMALLFTLGWGAIATAQVPQPGQFGVGVSLGAPTSVTGKYILNETMAIDAHIGGLPFFSVGFHGTVFVAGDLVIDWLELVDTDDFRISLYGGAGAMVLFNAGEVRVYDEEYNALVPFYRQGVGVRFPGGVAGQLKIAPIEFFVEISPSLALLFRPSSLRGAPVIPSVQLLHIGLGGRYYF